MRYSLRLCLTRSFVLLLLFRIIAHILRISIISTGHWACEIKRICREERLTPLKLIRIFALLPTFSTYAVSGLAIFNDDFYS